MKVLIISGNREASPEPPFPLGIAYLVRALEDQAHEVRVLDMMFADDAERAIADALREMDPDVVGVSMRNLDLLSFPQVRSEVPLYAGYVRTIRQHTVAPVVMGGPGFSLAPRSCLEQVGADVGISGEAEVALPALLTRIRIEEGLPDELRGQVIRTPPGIDLDRIEPRFDALDVVRYYEEGTGGSVQTRRGCRLACSYCTYPLIEGRRVRRRAPDDVADEVARLRDDHGIDHVTIVDSVFNAPEEHAIAVTRALSRLDPPVHWTAFFHPVFEDPGFFKLLAESHCEGLDLGVDSLSETVLARMRKGFHPGDVVAFSDGCRTAGLRFNLSMLFGAPGETRETVRETVECVERCDPDSVTVGIGVRLYPGSRVAEELIEEGAIDREQVGIETFYYLSEDVRDTLVDDLAEVAERDHRWIVPGLGKNYNPRFFKRLRKHGKRGPLWHLVRK